MNILKKVQWSPLDHHSHFLAGHDLNDDCCGEKEILGFLKEGASRNKICKKPLLH